jgi:translocation and assembly module TamB
MGRSSKLDGAIVNDEVSHRVLSFVAPVLDGATRVDGRISVELAEALLPILAEPDCAASIRGDVVFDDVRFMPGPLVDQLLSVLRMERRPFLVLRDSISVRVAERKVYQEGLSIPVGGLATIGLDGSVDFDKNLDLIARISMEPPRSNVPVLTPLMKLARFELPIRGTLTKPKIDGDALKERLKSFGTDLLDNSLQAGADSLQRLIRGLGLPSIGRQAAPTRRAAPGQPAPTRPDAPNALTPDGRKRLREQKRDQRLTEKARRRLQRSQPP